RGERLRERTHDQVDVIAQPEVRGCAVAPGAEDANRVRVVDGERGAVPLRDLEQVWHIRDVSLHRVDTSDDDPDAGAGRHLAPLALEAAEVAVVEAHRLTEGHLGA